MKTNMSQDILRRQFVSVLSLSGLGLAAVAGCSNAARKNVKAIREEYFLTVMPEGVMSLAEAYASFEDGKQVAVVGRIFADGMSPFELESAAFSLIELPKPGHDHDDPGDCPFCKRDMENAATAIVQVVDEAGQVLESSADQLFGLERNQDVVVEGRATKVGEILVMNVRGIHVLSVEDATEHAKRIHG